MLDFISRYSSPEQYLILQKEKLLKGIQMLGSHMDLSLLTTCFNSIAMSYNQVPDRVPLLLLVRYIPVPVQ